jgi:hypothetical protein
LGLKTGIVGWIVLGLLLLAVFGLTFVRTPEAIMKTLGGISRDVRCYSVLVHILFLAVVGLGLFVRKSRDGSVRKTV